MNVALVLVALSCSWIHTVTCQNNSDAKALYTDLFASYKKEVLPTADYSKPLEIGVTFFLISIVSFKEVEETLSVLGVFNLNWTDPALSWIPSDYGNLEFTVIDPSKMWIPPLFIINRVDEMKPIGHDTLFHTTIFSDGSVSYLPGSLIDVKCPTDLSKFPFDSQTCKFEILPWGFTDNLLVYTSVFKTARLDWYTKNSDWNVEQYDTTSSRKSNTSLFYFELKVKREPLYYAVMVILPTMLFGFLNPLVFILPADSGERMSFAMTILLSYAIFLTLVSASVPASSNPMCVLLLIMVVIISISGIIVIATIISSSYYHQDDMKEINFIIKRFTTWRINKKKNIIRPVNEDKEIVITGKDVAKSFDVLCFYTFYAIIIGCMAGYFIYVMV